ncbi:MAG: single-stranded DNA-binding protein [Burkholderiaceae bacterium]
MSAERKSRPTPPPPDATTAQALEQAALRLRDAVEALRFAAPVHTVYDPLDYAWAAHAQYLARYGRGAKTVVFLGMNPGPFGMMQTGVPFGEIATVRDWLGIDAPIAAPARQHPKRPIEGFACTRSEVSGRRLWGWARQRFGTPQAFFAQAFVVNYCPLVFLEASGRNLTPDKLPAAERLPLQRACDTHLQRVLEILRPQWAIGVGGYAAKRIDEIAARLDEPTRPRTGQILHPSPASPLANRGWAEAAEAQLEKLGILQLMTAPGKA